MKTVLALALCAVPCAAQGIPFSQHGSVSQRVGFTDIRIEYNRPVARGRHLFGSLVKWGRVWHPGADSATTITFSTGVLIENRPLAAGSYTLWAIPDSTQWTVIFSRALHVFHYPYPGDSLDVLRVNVTPQAAQHMEVLAFYFPVVGPDSATLQLHWGTTAVPIRIKIPPS
ncbi:MAG TPA: DUF2911 domain-containing protein [Gemmatimonadales bacterium]|nr:DUF2911 domain-containing protein [Gemmatimonadales bacterium]